MKIIIAFLSLYVSLIGFAGSEMFNCGLFVDPLGRAFFCKSIDILRQKDEGVSSPVLSVICSQTNDLGCVDSKYFLFSGNNVFDWILQGSRDDLNFEPIRVGNLPSMSGDFILAKGIKISADDTLTIYHKENRSFVSIMDVDALQKKKMSETIGGMHIPILPNVILGMRLREERFSYLDYERFKDIGFYTGLYVSDEGHFCFVVIVKAQDDHICDFLFEKGCVQFNSKSSQIQTEKMVLKKANEITSDCELVQDENNKQLRFILEIMGVRRSVQIPFTDSGWIN